MRGSGRISLARRALVVAALLTSVARAEAAPQQAAQPFVSEVAQQDLQAAQELLSRATAEFEGPQQTRSIILFDQIIDKLEGLRRQNVLPQRGRDILVQAFGFRGRAYYNLGVQEKAADSFRSLIQLDPQYTFSKDKVSPKIVDYFTSVKKGLVGYLAVSSKPNGAKVTLTGGGETRDLGLTDLFPVEVLAGEYTVEVAKVGYRSETRPLSIGPRATEVVAAELLRTAASAFFITEPAGVEIWVDGELRVTTAGGLSADAAALAQAKSLDPAKASARVEVGNLSPGSHVVELRKPCYETIRKTIELAEPRDYDTEPTRMEDSLASLRLTSDPPGAKIFIDGVAMGQTPREIEGVCSGKRRLEVKHASGKFIQDLVLSKNEGLTLDCPIRPSLAFLGVVAQSAAGERVLGEVEDKLVLNLAKMGTLNFIPAPRETVNRLLEVEKLGLKDLLPGAGTEPDLLRKVTEKLALALEVQGFLIARLPEERLQRTANLHLLAAGNVIPDVLDVNFTEAASFLRFNSRVDQKATVYRPWSGLITVDTQLHDGVPVLRIVAGSPAAQAGIQVGEVLVAADGKPVKSTLDFLNLVEKEKKPKDKVTLQLKGTTGTRTVDLTLGQTPQEVPLQEPTLLYNKVMMDLRQQVEGYPATETAAFARLNLALCGMHFSDFAAAHEHLLKARAELPQRPGVSQGTALYYLGLALEKLGYKKEAVDSYRAAAAFKDATLFNNDGPAVAPMAARRAGS